MRHQGRHYSARALDIAAERDNNLARLTDMTDRRNTIALTRPEWFYLLRGQRQRRRVSRKALAQECGLSEETVRAYEFGRRGPRRETLEKILRVLDLGPAEAKAIMHSAGFSSGPRIADLDWRKLREFGEQVPWPQSIATEDLYVLSMNSLLTKLTQESLDYKLIQGE